MYRAVIIISIILLSCNNADTGSDTAASSEKMIIENAGVKIDYTDSGKGDTVLFFVHGWGINKSYWENQVTFFHNKYRVITIDLPGYGVSGKNRNSWRVQDFGKDIDSVIYKLNLRNVLLVGHSMSGDIVVEAALHATDRVIAVIGVDNFKNFGAVPTAETKKFYALVLDSMRHDFRNIVTRYFNQQLFYKTTDSSIRSRVMNDIFSGDSTIAVATMADNDYDETANVIALKKKIYLINSDVLPTDSTGFKKNNVPFEIKYIHETGHYPMIEKPAAFNEALEIIMQEIKKD